MSTYRPSQDTESFCFREYDIDHLPLDERKALLCDFIFHSNLFFPTHKKVSDFLNEDEMILSDDEYYWLSEGEIPRSKPGEAMFILNDIPLIAFGFFKFHRVIDGVQVGIEEMEERFPDMVLKYSI